MGMRKVDSGWELLHRISDNRIWDRGPILLGAVLFLPAHVITMGSPVTWQACSRLAASVEREFSSRAQGKKRTCYS